MSFQQPGTDLDRMKIVFLLPDRFEAFRKLGTRIETFYFDTGFPNQYCRSLSKLGHDVSLFYMSTEAKETSVTKHIFGHKIVKSFSEGTAPPQVFDNGFQNTKN